MAGASVGSDLTLVVSSLGYLLVLGLLLQASGFDESPLILPGNPTLQASGEFTQSIPATFTECLITSGLIPFLALLDFIADLPIVDCSAKTETGFFRVLLTGLQTLGHFLKFMFQLVTFQIPEIPVLLTAILVGPPLIGLGYVGVRVALDLIPFT